MSAAIAAAGWRWALVALGVALGAGGLLVRAALPPERTGAGQAGERPAEHAGLWQLLRRRQVAAVLAAGTIAAGGRGLGTLSTYIPAYLRSGLHLSTLTVGTLFTLIMAASIVGPVAGGLLADRFGRARTLTVTYIAAAIAVAAFGLAGRSLWVLALLGVCVGVLAYAESPLLQAVFADLTGDGAARTAFGAFFAISYGVGSLWVAVIGWIITTAGFPAAFAAMAASFAAAAVIIGLVVRDESSSPAESVAEDPA
jgi:predicted MFS family arabinose efflux permease